MRLLLLRDERAVVSIVWTLFACMRINGADSLHVAVALYVAILVSMYKDMRCLVDPLE